MEDFKQKMMKSLQKYKYFAVFLLIGVCFMFLSSTEEVANVTEISSDFDVTQVEQRLEAILSKIDGVGDVFVMITTQTGTKNVYATNKTEELDQNGDQIQQNTQTEYVLVNPTNSTEQALKIYDVFPDYKGVLVVCEGGDLDYVKLEILQAVRSLCGVSSENITISKMKE